MARKLRWWWEQDAFTPWRKLYATFNRPGEAKKVKARANRYGRRVDRPRHIAEQLRDE